MTHFERIARTIEIKTPDPLLDSPLIAAHGNAHAIDLDPTKELKSLRIECHGTETFVGLLGITLMR